MQIEAATYPDSGRLAAAHALCFESGWSAAEIARLLQQPAVFAQMAEHGDDVAALALIRVVLEEAEVLTIGVTPDYRRAGVAADLLASCEAEARERGAGRMFLEVSAANVAARALYDRAGYSEIGVRRRYYADGQDAQVLEKSLASCGQNGS